MSPRLSRLAALAGVLALALVGFFLAKNQLRNRFLVRAYFSDGSGLREGAPVRLRGIDIGSVKSIRLRPDPKTPVEVVMGLDPKYGSTIPNDSTVLLATAGVLGEAYVQVDTSRASGPPIQVNGVLQSIEARQIAPQEAIQKLTDALNKSIEHSTDALGEKCPCADQASSSPGTKSLASTSKPAAPKH